MPRKTAQVKETGVSNTGVKPVLSEHTKGGRLARLGFNVQSSRLSGTSTHFPQGADKRPDTLKVTLPHQVQTDLPALEGTPEGSFGVWGDIRNLAGVFTVPKPPADQAPCLAGWSDLAQQEAVSTHSLDG